MDKIQKIDNELAKLKDKAAELAAKIKELERQRQEEENSQIISAVRSLKLTPTELAVFLASGQLGPKSQNDKKEDSPNEA
mgnify:CR=1 FL=1